MVLWILFAVMTAAACLLILRPFQSLKDKGQDTLTSTDIYKDQLAELKRDLKDGLITAQEMEATQIEISRRILEAPKSPNKKTSSKRETSRHKGVVLSMLFIVPAVSVPLYLWVGQPNFEPVTQAQLKKLEKKQPSTQQLLQQVETHLSKNPNDINGWIVLARVYANMGRKEDVKRATDNIKRIRDQAEDIKKMSKEDRMSMIKSMVASLHEKLKEDSENVEGWERLIQSYIVLGEKDKAYTSFLEARSALSDNKEAQDRLTEFVKKFNFN